MKSIVLLTLALSACALETLHSRLPRYVGQDIHRLIRSWGYPNEVREIAGDRVYVWGASSTGVHAVSPRTAVPITWTCRIEVVTDKRNVITDFHVQGNEGGCGDYAERLQ